MLFAMYGGLGEYEEWVLAVEHLEHARADRPDVGLVVVLGAAEDLGRHV